MLRGHVWAPDRPLARARPRQPRVHRPRRLHREGEADRANTRRAAGPKPAGGGGGFGCDQMAAAATMGRALRGRRAARVQRAARGPQAGHVLRLRARRCRVCRVLVPLRSPALGSMIGAMPATYGDPVVAHPSTGRARPAPLQGRERHADAGTWCVRTARGARRARGGRKVQFYRPAGAIFTRARRAVQYERDEIEILYR